WSAASFAGPRADSGNVMPEGWVLQHSWVASVALELPVARLQRANISDDFLQISLAHPALEARHHRLVAGDDVFMWMQEGIADIGLIGDDRRAIGQRQDRKSVV